MSKEPSFDEKVDHFFETKVGGRLVAYLLIMGALSTLFLIFLGLQWAYNHIHIA